MATGGFVHWPPPTKEPNHYAQPYIPVPEGWEPSTEKANLMTETSENNQQTGNGFHYCVSCGDVCHMIDGKFRHMAVNPITGRWDATTHHVHAVAPSKKVHPTLAYSWSVGRKSGDRLKWHEPINLKEAAVSEERRDYGTSDSPMTKAEYESLPRVSAESTQGSGEIRMTDPTTGAQKGSKEARFDLIPVGPLTELAELYGFGAKKYAARNWERGYDFSLSYAALQRHANLFWGGEDRDAETGKTHLSSVAWHAFTLMQLLETHPEKDDRPSRVVAGDMNMGEFADLVSGPESTVVWAHDHTKPMTEKEVLKMSESMSQKLKNAEALQEYENLELQEIYETMSTLSRQGLSRVINEAGRRLEFEDEAKVEKPLIITSTYPEGWRNRVNPDEKRFEWVYDPASPLTVADAEAWEAANPKTKSEVAAKANAMSEDKSAEQQLEEELPLVLDASNMMEVGILISRMSVKQLLEVANAVEKQLESDD